MASKYARAIGGNWGADATWSTTSGGAADTTAPTAADDVFLDASSGNVTINSGSTRFCRSINCTGYTGTLTHDAGVSLDIGDGTAGASNIALKFVAGMTYTLGSATTSAIGFISTSATTQTVDYSDKTTGNVTYGNASTLPLIQYLSGHTGATIDFRRGTLDLNGQTMSWGIFTSNVTTARTFTMGAASIALTGTGSVWVMNTSSLTFSGASSTITASGTGVTLAIASSLTYGTINLTGSGTITLTGSSTIGTLNRTGTAAKTDALSLGNNITVTGTLTLAGNSATNRLLVQSNTVGSQRTITNTGATETWSNVDFMDIALSQSFDASAITGNSGDCGGNSNITFTTAATQTCTMSTNKNWDDVTIWTSRVPLPQDDVSMASVTGGQLATNGVPRLGRDIDWTGASGGPSWGFNLVSNSIFGSVILISGMSLSGSSTTTFAGRGTHTITSAGQQFLQNIIINCPGGTYTLQDALSCAQDLDTSRGGFDSNDYSVTIRAFLNGGTNTRTVDWGTSTITINSTSSTNWLIVATGLTMTASSAIIVLNGSSTTTKTFSGGNQTYGTLTYTLSGSTGALVITGTNTFNTINFSDDSNARLLRFPAGVTTTITGTFNVNGTSGKLMSIDSSTGGSAATLSKASGTVSCDYLSIQDSTATGGASWYAGANSTDNGGNTGWIFSAPAVTVSGTTFGEIEYSAYAAKTGVSGISLNEQKLKFYNNALGTNYISVDEAEIAFLKNKTNLYDTNSIDQLWRSYMVSRGVTFSNSMHDMKYAFFQSYGFL